MKNETAGQTAGRLTGASGQSTDRPTNPGAAGVAQLVERQLPNVTPGPETPPINAVSREDSRDGCTAADPGKPDVAAQTAGRTAGAYSPPIWRGGTRPQSEESRLRSLHERMATRYAVDPATGCWFWTGRRAGGYGIIKSSGANLRAHVVSFEMHYGPVPGGLIVCHRCGRAQCVNPGHLYAGTTQDNARDAARHGVTPGMKLSIDQVRDIKAALAAGATRSELAVRYGVHKNQIGKIDRGERWAWIDTEAA